MFAPLKAELASRSIQVAAFWRLIDNLEAAELSNRQAEPSLRTLKGLIFVHFYSVYEYVVVESFACLVRQFNSHAITFTQIKRSMLAIGFSNEFKSLKDLSERRAWESKIELFQTAESQQPIQLAGDSFPRDESHFRDAQLETICRILDLPSNALIPTPRFIGWIREMVENRNSIAHGRATAEYVGSRYSSPDLDRRRSELDQLCNHIIATLEAHSLQARNFHR